EDDEPARLTGLPRAKILRAHGAVKAARTPREPRGGRLVALSAANRRGRANRDEDTEREAPRMAPPARQYLFTSESVTEGHPDKVADQISGGVLDAVLAQDPNGRVACETLVKTGLVVVSGEISTTATFDVQDIARETIARIGYTDASLGFSAGSCAVLNAVDKQSADIAQGVDAAYETRQNGAADDEFDAAGAGDQGMMFGYATNETPELMPVPIALAHRLARRLAQVRKDGTLDYLRPDGKTQVSVRYADGVPVGIEKLLISTQHAEGSEARLRDDLW